MLAPSLPVAHGPSMSGLYTQVLVSPHLGGAEKIAVALHEHVVRTRGPVSRMLVPRGGSAEAYARRSGASYQTFRLDWLLSASPFEASLANLDLMRPSRAGQASLIHFHSPVVFGAARILRRFSRIKTILHVHLNYTPDELRWPLSEPPDVILACGPSAVSAVEEVLGARPHRHAPRIRVIHNAVDTNIFHASDRLAAKHSLGYPGSPLAVVVANIAPHKGQETAIRAISALRGDGLDVRLCLVGEERGGQQFTNKLQMLVEQLGVQDLVQFLGFRNDIPTLLQAADFMLLPSSAEAMPLSVLEAQASGCLVLAAPTADIPVIVNDGVTGFLIPAGDPLGYATRIKACLSSPSQTHAICAAATAQIQRSHELGHYNNAVLEEYERLTGKEAMS